MVSHLLLHIRVLNLDFLYCLLVLPYRFFERIDLVHQSDHLRKNLLLGIYQQRTLAFDVFE
jgi:hypothetical protein